MRAQWLTALSLAFLTAIAAASAGCSRNATPPGTTTAAPEPAQPPITQIAADLPPLPPGLMNAARPVAVTKAAYEFAARHPEVMNFIPCFCGCERGGHKGNHDCFVAGRDSSGRVTTWDAHGLNCQVCIDVAYESARRHALGETVSQIRTAIDRMYAGAAFRTPTPMPPGHGGHPAP
jgi:hypothetical protein